MIRDGKKMENSHPISLASSKVSSDIYDTVQFHFRSSIVNDGNCELIFRHIGLDSVLFVLEIVNENLPCINSPLIQFLFSILSSKGNQKKSMNTQVN